jgi:hypothetical protein
MIEALVELRQTIESENQRILLLDIFNDKGFITSRFMRAAEKEFKSVNHLIVKQAMTGLSETKKIILQGFNLLFNKDIKNFDTLEEALNFLADDATSDAATKKN